MKKIAVLGSGVVGQTLADGFLKHGHEVMRASRDASKLADWKKSAGDKARTGTFADGAAFGDIVVLAVKGTAAESAVDLCDGRLAGKTVLDTTNPITESPPRDGVIQFFTAQGESLMQRLQDRAPSARFVKAFSCVGSAFMIDPNFGSEKPTMFICGDDDTAKAEATALLAEVGWEIEDMGTVAAAAPIEQLCVLWCIPGLRTGKWAHAFKLLKK
jgi:hypothetical protein